MPEETDLHQIVAAAVAQVLDAQVPKLRDEIVAQVLRELPSYAVAQPVAASSEAAPSTSAALLKSITTIQAGNSQKEILRALLDCTASYCSRAALFVVKGAAATGWQGCGFSNNEDIKDFALDAAGGVAFEALHSRIAAIGRGEELDPQFASRFNIPSDERVVVLPLLLKDKVAALVYCDPGTDQLLDIPALDAVVRATSAWLEVVSLRKQGSKEPAASHDAVAAPVQTVSSFSDPFASHVPRHVAPQPSEPALAQASAAAAGTAPAPQLSAEDAETHRKAQRFARLLMDEIKLYNQAQVGEGRKNRDLYDRLKEDIEKSRATYQKRYGSTVASTADYFSHEVVRSLAEDDATLMGANFHG